MTENLPKDRTFDYKKEVLKLRYDKHWTLREIADHLKTYFPDLTPQQLYKKAGDVCRRTKEEPISDGEQKTVWKNGQLESDRLIEICETEDITPDLILKLHNLKPHLWEVVSYTNNRWHAQKKGGTRIVQYQSKLVAKPITDRVTFEDVEQYFAGKEYPSPRTIQSSGYDPSSEVLEIDVADLHAGLLSWSKEVGENYDVRIAKKRFMYLIQDNVERCKDRKFKKIILALLGDLIHIDNNMQTTTKGTFQQADGRIAKIFETTLDMLIEGISILSGIAPVDVVYTSGNHDETTGWMLIKSLEMAYLNVENVHIDVDPNPQKTRLIGNSLIGFVHGDMSEKNLSGWLQVQARRMANPVRYLEVHSGHRHALKVKERIQTEDSEGVIVRTIPTVASSSSWEHREGYSGATCASVSFIWHEKRGLREMWISNICN